MTAFNYYHLPTLGASLSYHVNELFASFLAFLPHCDYWNSPQPIIVLLLL